MRALTLTQPWADAVAYGGKDTENRTWSPPATAVGRQRLWIVPAPIAQEIHDQLG